MQGGGTVQVICLPEEHPLAPVLQPLAAAAARRLELPDHLAALTLCLDDIAPDDRVWFSFGSGDATARGEAPPVRLTLYLHPDLVTRDRPASLSVMPAVMDWEQHQPPADAAGEGAEDLSRAKAERFLYHHLLFVRDLRQGRLTRLGVPRRHLEALQELWAITVDGRLRHWNLPGYSAAERRRRFLRVFSVAGVLLPEHWQIFHELWEEEEIGAKRLLHMLERLPRL
jgi:hypothetical protein